jgi:hypothetical protein
MVSFPFVLLTQDEVFQCEKVIEGSNTPFKDHVGGGNDVEHEMNQSGFRNRGYGAGSIYATWGNDNQYMQPGHALAQQTSKSTDAKIAYKPNKNTTEAWDPTKE